MKRVLLTVSLITVLAVAANAQQGSILVYGNLDLKSISGSGGGQFSVNPGVGYQFNDSWTAGVEGGYNYYDNGGSGSFSIVKSYQFNAFIRQAVALSPIFAYYTQLGLGYQHAATGTFSNGGVYAYITPNIGVNLKNSFGLNFGFGGLSYGPSSTNVANSGKVFEFSFGKGASFGISKNFGGTVAAHHHMHKRD